jgi:hypothetical protein
MTADSVCLLLELLATWAIWYLASRREAPRPRSPLLRTRFDDIE